METKTFEITLKDLSFEEIGQIIDGHWQISLSKEVIAAVQKCRDYLDQKTKTHPEPIYGVTTGFGSLCNVSISEAQLSQLQKNLMMSHACGLGEPVPQEVVKLMLLMKIKSLSYGNSGVQVVTIQRLVDFFNNDVLPVVYQQGSLGASGDLAPLAHMCLPLIGLGEVWVNGEKRPASEVLAQHGWQPVELASKEGLALLNGTQFMSAFAVHNVMKAQHLSKMADLIGALSLEAFDGRIEPFYPEIQEVRRHQGQVDTAAAFRKYLEGSEMIKRHKTHVQDPYSFRCIPQVHGASKDAIEYVSRITFEEINAVTDNPTVFPDKDLVISAGNFHGQPLALTQDFLSIAVAELGNISERRTYQLIAGKRELPSFLVKKPGLNSGFMIPQYAAASIVSQSKQLCCPASVDSIEASQGQEDHVSMGANAATKAYRVMDNTERVLAIELFNAAQAFEFRRPVKTSPILEEFLAAYRKEVAFVEDDSVMYPLIQKSVDFVRNWKI